MNLGKKIKLLREVSELTQKELAQKLNIAQSNISKFESGKLDVSSDILKQLSEIFRVTTDYLLEESENMDSAYKSTVLTGEQIPKHLRDIGIEYLELYDYAKKNKLSANEIKEILENTKNNKYYAIIEKAIDSKISPEKLNSLIEILKDKEP